MWLQLKTVTPHANQPEQLHAALSLPLSLFLLTWRGRFQCRSLHPSQPTRAGFSRCKPVRETDRPTEAETETWQTAKKKEFIISVLIAFFILSKFSAPAGAISRVSVTSRAPHLPRGRGILHVQATSFTNKQLFARNSIMPFNNRRDKLGEISYTN